MGGRALRCPRYDGADRADRAVFTHKEIGHLRTDYLGDLSQCAPDGGLTGVDAVQFAHGGKERFEHSLALGSPVGRRIGWDHFLLSIGSSARKGAHSAAGPQRRVPTSLNVQR
jgi:hypothetical protein